MISHGKLQTGESASCFFAGLFSAENNVTFYYSSNVLQKVSLSQKKLCELNKTSHRES